MRGASVSVLPAAEHPPVPDAPPRSRPRLTGRRGRPRGAAAGGVRAEPVALALPRSRRSRPRATEGGGRRLRGRALLALGALPVCLLIGDGAAGYRFVPAYDGGSRIASAEGAARWSEREWGPGRVQEWVIADAPGWTEPFVDREGETQPPPFARTADAVPFVRQAMAAWTAIPSADIRWRLSGVESVPGNEQDYRNTVTVAPDEGRFAGRAWWWYRRSHFGGPWELIECDIELIPQAAAFLGSDDPRSLSTTIHEFGHCLGLAHSGRHPTIVHTFPDIGIWGETPKMSYGLDISNGLAVDDIVAASLLRPAGDWVAGTGAITGRVTVGGAPGRFISVSSVRLVSGDETAPGPGVFTDEEGRFRLEGLVPGDYLIRAAPMTRVDAHETLLEAGAVVEALDGARLRPVTVRAGQETGGAVLELPRGRTGSDFVR